MAHYIDKEYHPVIENFITEYVDGDMDLVEKKSFEEVLVHDDDLRELAFSAKEGKKLLERFCKIKAKEGFAERMLATLSKND